MISVDEEVSFNSFRDQDENNVQYLNHLNDSDQPICKPPETIVTKMNSVQGKFY